MTLPPLAAVTNGISTFASVEQRDVDRFKSLKEGVPGWSELTHYLFFREILKAKPNGKWLVCGVYHGLDLRLIAGSADALGQHVSLAGVDLFSDGPMADWPEEKKGMTWKEAMGCAPPDMEAAKRNCPTATIFKGDSAAFMRNQVFPFDVIFLDSSHDGITLSREIAVAKRLVVSGGFIGGDDYNWPNETVSETVGALLPQHVVFFHRLWLAQIP